MSSGQPMVLPDFNSPDQAQLTSSKSKLLEGQQSVRTSALDKYESFHFSVLRTCLIAGNAPAVTDVHRDCNDPVESLPVTIWRSRQVKLTSVTGTEAPWAT
jgi:hypothetical protein